MKKGFVVIAMLSVAVHQASASDLSGTLKNISSVQLTDDMSLILKGTPYVAYRPMERMIVKADVQGGVSASYSVSKTTGWVLGHQDGKTQLSFTAKF